MKPGHLDLGYQTCPDCKRRVRTYLTRRPPVQVQLRPHKPTGQSHWCPAYLAIDQSAADTDPRLER